MLTEYQESYRQKLIAKGLAADDAFRVASRTAEPKEPVSTPPPEPTRPRKAPKKAAEPRAEGAPPASVDDGDASFQLVPLQAASPAPPNPRTAQDLERISRGEQLSLFDLAQWGDDQRGLPNDFARTAIFSARNHKTPREYFMRKPLYSTQKDVLLTATGHELRVYDDEKVFNQLCEIGKRHAAGQEFEFHFGAFCKELKWPSNGNSYRRLTDSLIRLQTFAIHLETPRLGGKLVSVTLAGRLTVHERENKRRTYGTISLPREILTLFAGQHFSKQDWNAILELKPTSRRLFDYAQSHRVPHPLPIRSFAQMAFLTGYTDARLRQLCKQMCAELLEHGLVESAWLDENDLIRLVRLNGASLQAK